MNEKVINCKCGAQKVEGYPCWDCEETEESRGKWEASQRD